MLLVKDQLNRTIRLQNFPKRIISLVPSQTELLYDLGLDDKVVGITKFCVHPEKWFRTKTRVGGTKKVNSNAINKLLPDLIIANKEENSKEDIQELAKKYPIWVSNILNLSDALTMINTIGTITQTEKLAQNISATINQNFNLLANEIKKTRSVAYLIWNNPMMVAGTSTFINDMLIKCGFVNVFEQPTERYPIVTFEILKSKAPEIVLLSSEPFPFNKKNKTDFQQILTNSSIHLVDGELFSWYGSRLLKSTAYFKQLHKAIP